VAQRRIVPGRVEDAIGFRGRPRPSGDDVRRRSQAERRTPRAVRKISSLPIVWPIPAAIPSSQGGSPVAATTAIR